MLKHKFKEKFLLLLLVFSLILSPNLVNAEEEEDPPIEDPPIFSVYMNGSYKYPYEGLDEEEHEGVVLDGFEYDVSVEEEGHSDFFRKYLKDNNYNVQLPLKWKDRYDSEAEPQYVDAVTWGDSFPDYITEADCINGNYVKRLKLPQDGKLKFFKFRSNRTLLEGVDYAPQDEDFYFCLPHAPQLKGYKLEDASYPTKKGKKLTIDVSYNGSWLGNVYFEDFKGQDKLNYDIGKLTYRRILTPHNDPILKKLAPWLKYHTNMVRLNLICKNKEGKELQRKALVGLEKYELEALPKNEDFPDRIVLKYKETPSPNPKNLETYLCWQNYFQGKEEELRKCSSKAQEHISKYHKDVNEGGGRNELGMVEDWYLCFNPKNITPYKIPGRDDRVGPYDTYLCPKNYFYLDQKETETIQAPEIPGYKRPVAQEVSFKYNDTDFRMNEEDFVWEKDVVFTYEKEEDPTPQPGKFEVNYYVDDEIYTTTSATPAKPLTKPTNPVKEGHSFVGWFEKNGREWDFSKVPTGNLKLYAKFAPVDKTKLEAKIKDLEALKAGDFTSATWVDLQVSLRLAKQALEKENVSQKQIDERLEDLQRAYLALERSSSNPDEPTPPAPKKLSILEVKNPKDIKVNLGTSEDKAKEELDRYVKIIASDKKTYYAPLTWSIYNYDKDKSAVYTAKGSYRIPSGFEDANTQKITTAKVEVLGQSSGDFKYFENLDKIKIKKGEKLTLPTQVVAHYKDGSKKSLSVTWETKNFDSNKVGTSWIYGKVEGLEAKPSICVEVINESQDLTNKKVSVLRDVRGHWAQDAIVWTVENNLFYGNAQQEFEPNKKITRGEFISVLFRLTGERSENYLNTHFDDVHKGEYFQGAIEWGRRNNVVSGYGDGKFHPDDTLTREQEAAILRRFNNVMNFKFEGVGRKTFADEGRISDWAKEDVRTIQVQGLMTGNQYNQFMPKKQITRAEIAQILYNMNNRVIGTRVTQSNTNTTTTMGSSLTTSSGTRHQGILPINNGTSTTINPGTTPDKNQNSTTKQSTATVSIDILTGLRNLNAFSSNMQGRIPSSGYFLSPTKISIIPGESVWDVTQRAANQYGISIRKEFTPKYNSIYVQAINGIGEFDGGQRSGWMYNINGIYPNRGASAIKVKNGDTIQWRYTMDYGNDIGGYLGDY
ncbi:Endo-1,4-beta-xylanase A precursor [Urinicoccus massiliensis]|uniref:Endo-1,4-beta-xylanase A n=2 Tax=Urinicoccus massiliensis TaxID=1723382 RepID=A0A8H2MFM7_9FIRM|nr:Endo-1,4-beta-xylanase A precursor [Urinicoccus massiliensis]